MKALLQKLLQIIAISNCANGSLTRSSKQKASIATPELSLLPLLTLILMFVGSTRGSRYFAQSAGQSKASFQALKQ